MARYNFDQLLHRKTTFTINLPDGSSISNNTVIDIPVSIPQIQRDYAEGRNDAAIERKRHNMLSDMLDVVYGIKIDLSLDFVYGYLMNAGRRFTFNGGNGSIPHYATPPAPVFEPLDGQQRLTTLFLLYWLFGRNNTIQMRQSSHSMLQYKTRVTSEEFCNWLVVQQAQIIIYNWQKERKQVESQNKLNESKWYTEKNEAGEIDPIINRLRYPVIAVPSLMDYMKSLNDFKWGWYDDPTVKSMITVIEHAHNLIIEKGWSYANGITNNINLDNISFMLLDDLDCDGDALFEKMNARGKPLTSFEVLKSSLEEEMERQYPKNTNNQLATDWRDRIDGNWLDYCWDRSSIGLAPKLEDIRRVEQKLERLIIRMIAMSFFNKNIVGATPTPNAKDYKSIFEKSISTGSLSVFDLYLDYIRHEKALNSVLPTLLDFQCVFDDIENMLYQDANNEWCDASQMIHRIYLDKSNTLMDDYISDSITHYIRVRVYAMTKYLNTITNAKSIANNISGHEKANFVDWMRFICNIYNGANSRLDDFSDVKRAISAIDDWLKEFQNNNSYSSTAHQAILSLITNYIANNHNSQESERINEEVLKAELRRHGSGNWSAVDWEQSILKAEDNYYLWGQIIAPLSWAKTNNGYNKDQFDNYMARLNDIFQISTKIDATVTDALFVQAMLCKNDYRFNMDSKGLGSLGRFDFNRDYSWKRHLRTIDNNSGIYGLHFKELIDDWMSPPNSTKTFDDFLKDYINVGKSNIGKNDWRYFIVNIQDPQTLLKIFNDTVRTNSRYVYAESTGHAYYFKSNTHRTYYRYELLTTYLANEKRLLQNGIVVSDVCHAYDNLGAHVDLTKQNGETYRVIADENNQYYSIEQLDNSGCSQSVRQSLDINGVETFLTSNGLITNL